MLATMRALLAITLLLAAAKPAIATCLEAPVKLQSQREAIVINYNSWASSRLNAELACLLLVEAVGLPCELHDASTVEFWDLMADGTIDANLEVWPSGRSEQLELYINERGDIIDGGPLGVVGGVVWGLSSSILEVNDELDHYRGFQDIESVADLGGEVANGTVTRPVEFIGAPGDWISWDDRLIEELGLHLEHSFSESGDHYNDRLLDALGNGRPYIGYFWHPHPAQGPFEISFVTLPPYSEECAALTPDERACGYPQDVLTKIISAKTGDKSPEALAFLRAFTLTGADHVSMLSDNAFDGLTFTEAACVWALSHDTIWDAWVASAFAASPSSGESDSGAALRIALVLGLASVVAGLYVAMQLRHPQGQNFLILIVGLGVIDLVTDTLYAIYAFRTDKAALGTEEIVFLVFLSFPLVINIVGVVAFVRYVTRTPEFSGFLRSNETGAAFVLLLAVVSPMALLLFGSGIGGLETMSAPWVAERWRWLSIVTMSPYLVEDIPQLALLSTVASKVGLTDISLIALLVTSAMLVTGAAKVVVKSLTNADHVVAYEETKMATSSPALTGRQPAKGDEEDVETLRARAKEAEERAARLENLLRTAEDKLALSASASMSSFEGGTPRDEDAA